jgi:LysM repeat protein
MRTATQGTGAFSGGATTPSAYSDYDGAYDSVNSFNQGSSASSYTVQAGDTLSSIAAQLWGDANLWYKLAEINGLTGDETLIENTILTIPAGVMRSSNTAATFTPYDPNETLGSTAPTAAKPPKHPHGCGIAQVLISIIAIAVVAIVAPYATAAIGNMMGVGTFSVSGSLLSAGGLIVTGAAGATVPLAASIAGGAIAGAAGSIVSQGVAVMTGIQDKFSWSAVGMAAVAGGLGGAGKLGVGGHDLAATVARGVVSNVITQGVELATHMQSNFDWAGVAGAAAGAAASYLTGEAFTKTSDAGEVAHVGAQWSTLAAQSGASLIANAATRSLIDGSDFGDNVLAALPDAIAQTVSNIFSAAMNGEFNDVKGDKEADAANIVAAKEADAAALVASKEYASTASAPSASASGYFSADTSVPDLLGSTMLMSPRREASLLRELAGLSGDGDAQTIQVQDNSSGQTDDLTLAQRMYDAGNQAMGPSADEVAAMGGTDFEQAQAAGNRRRLETGVEYGRNSIDAYTGFAALPEEGAATLTQEIVVHARPRGLIEGLVRTFEGIGGWFAERLGISCFAAGTLIHTREGLKPIEQLRDGDVVWSRSQYDVGEAAWRPVVEWGCTGEKEIYEVRVSTADGRTETYRTTEMHPFWVETGGDEGTGGFVAAGWLERGDRLRLADGSPAYVTSVEATGVTEPVYNFSVEGWHTYHVGEIGVWVHNDCVTAKLQAARATLSPVARSQLDAIEGVANTVRADLVRDPRRLLGVLTDAEQAALRRDPSLLRMYFGNAVHRTAAAIIEARARDATDILYGVRVGSRSLAPDHFAINGAQIDITTRTLSEVTGHLRNSNIQAVASYHPVSTAEHNAIVRTIWPYLP